MDEDMVAAGARPAADSAIARLRTRNQVTARYTVWTDRDWAEQLKEARDLVAQLTAAGKTGSSEFADAKVALDAMEADKANKTVVFELRSLSPAAYEVLISKHRPTPEQIEAHKAAGGYGTPRWNSESFPAALTHASLLNPPLTFEEVASLWSPPDDKPLLTPVEAMELFNHAVLASNQTVQMDD